MKVFGIACENDPHHPTYTVSLPSYILDKFMDKVIMAGAAALGLLNLIFSYGS